MDSANLSSIVTDATGMIQIFNVGAQCMLGYSANEVVNKITPADISDPHEVIARAQALSSELDKPVTPGFEALVYKATHGIGDIYELTYIRKDGSRFPTVVSVTALRAPQNDIIGYLLIGIDNTAHKRDEAEREKLDQRLRDQQFYARSLLESSIDALMATDPDGIITDVNLQMELLTACTRDELIGTPSKKYFTNPERAAAGIEQVLKANKVSNYELTVRAGDGKETDVSCYASTYYDRSGKLQGVFAAVRDITQHKLAEEKILRLAFHDSLTGLSNRRQLSERLGRAMAASKRSGLYGALIFLDLDKFKALNDTRGHGVGDLLLVEVAQRISNCVREVDVVARFGGDEFVVILSELSKDKYAALLQSTIVAEKIRIILGNPYVLKVQSKNKGTSIEYTCTASIGVALFLNHKVATDEVIRWADTAMYLAKESGGDSIRYFEN